MFRRRKKKQETSDSGQPVYRHEHTDREFVPAGGPNPDTREQLESHLERYLGPTTSVFHEIVSDLVHLDVYIWEPTDERPMYTFVTGGMSDLAMTVPSEAIEVGCSDRAELMICLPPTWSVPKAMGESWSDNAYFPIRSLKQLARLPHEYSTWLGYGHTIPNGDPPERLSPDTYLSGWVLLPPATLPEEAHQLDIEGIGRIDIFGLVALHTDEMDRKLAQGVESLLDGFDRHGVNELLELARPTSLF